MRPLRVLVADDCRDTTDTTAELIGLWGHDARRAYGGADALEVAADFRPDVLLADLTMRGVDGFELAGRVRRLPGLAAALLIAVTGHTGAGHRRRAAAAGFDFYVLKPVDPTTLGALLMSRQVKLVDAPTVVDDCIREQVDSGDQQSLYQSHVGPTAGEYREYRTSQEDILMDQLDRLPEMGASLTARPADRCVLVVDDDGGVRRFLAAGLRRAGFDVLLAASGPEAADLLRTGRPEVDVVLMDVLMPGRDGPASLAALREQDPAVLCCFMSGDLGEYTEDGLRQLGTGEVLRKPFTLAEAGRVLRGEIRRQDEEDAVQDDHWRDDGGQGQRPAPRRAEPAVSR